MGGCYSSQKSEHQPLVLTSDSTTNSINRVANDYGSIHDIHRTTVFDASRTENHVEACQLSEADILRTLLRRLAILLFLSLLVFLIPFSVVAEWWKVDDDEPENVLAPNLARLISSCVLLIYRLGFVNPWFLALFEVNKLDEHFKDWKAIKHTITIPKRIKNWILSFFFTDDSVANEDAGNKALCCVSCCNMLSIYFCRERGHWNWEPFCFLFCCRRCWFYFALGSGWSRSLFNTPSHLPLRLTDEKRLWSNRSALLLRKNSAGDEVPNDIAISGLTYFYVGGYYLLFIHFFCLFWMSIVTPLSKMLDKDDDTEGTTVPPQSFYIQCVWLSFTSLALLLFAWASLGIFLSAAPSHVLGIESASESISADVREA